MRTAAFSVSKAAWAAGNFRAQVCDAVHAATTKVSLTNDNVAGVKLPVFNEVRPWCGATAMVPGNSSVAPTHLLARSCC